jgi:hypothetical protein
MKHNLILLIITILFSSCANEITYCDQGVTKEVGSYGLFTQSSADPNVKYEASAGNAIWSIILIETIIAPVYFVGWSIMTPVSTVDGCTHCPCETGKSTTYK